MPSARIPIVKVICLSESCILPGHENEENIPERTRCGGLLGSNTIEYLVQAREG